MNDYKNTDEYISLFPPHVQLILQQLRKSIRDLIPEAEETISYGIPTFRLYGNLVHYAAYKNHIGFFIIFVTLQKVLLWFLKLQEA